MNKKQIIILILVLIISLGMAISILFYVTNDYSKSGERIHHKNKIDLSELLECTNKDTENKCFLNIKGVEINYNFDANKKKMIKLYINNKQAYEFKYNNFKKDYGHHINIFEVNNKIILWRDKASSDCYEELVVFNKNGKILYNSNDNDYSLCKYEVKDNEIILNFTFKQLVNDGLYMCNEKDYQYIKENGDIDVKYKNILTILEDEVGESISSEQKYQNYCESINE